MNRDGMGCMGHGKNVKVWSQNCQRLFFNVACHNHPASKFKHAAPPQADPRGPGRLHFGGAFFEQVPHPVPAFLLVCMAGFFKYSKT